MSLTHLDGKGHAHMVDVSGKTETARVAVAEATVQLNADTMALLQTGDVKKGDALGVARLAGIMGAKKTSELIPLCHPLPITKVTVDLDLHPETNEVHITGLVKTKGQTGVEMEALTAVSTAALTLYDMLKAVDKSITITNIQLVEKQGGKSGHWQRDAT